MTVVVAALAAMIGGWHAGLSALIGGAACLVPNALFALRLAVESRRPGGATVHGFFIGEFVKIAATIGALVLVATIDRNVNWPALIVGFIAALKSYYLRFAFRRGMA